MRTAQRDRSGEASSQPIPGTGGGQLHTTRQITSLELKAREIKASLNIFVRSE